MSTIVEAIASLLSSQKVLLEELKGPTMTSEALSKIGAFVPRLEKVHMDDLFTDTNIMLDIIKMRSDNIVDAWKDLANNVVNCPIAKRKLRCLSLPGNKKLAWLRDATSKRKTVYYMYYNIFRLFHQRRDPWHSLAGPGPD